MSEAASAVELLRRRLETDPADAESWHALALTEAAAGAWPEAIAYFEQAVKLRPLAANFWANLALARGRAGDWAGAAGDYRRSLDLRPAHADSLAKLGRALVRCGDNTEGIGWLGRAVELEPTADNRNALGAALAETQRYDEAARELLAALQADPTHEEAVANARALAAQLLIRGAEAAEPGQWREAEQDFHLAAQLAPENAEAYFHLGLAQSALGLLPEAARSYEAAVARRAGYAEAWNNLSHVVLALGDARRALDLAGRAIAIRPDYSDAHYNQGVILQSVDRFDEAASAYQRVLEREPDNASAWNNLGSLAMGENDLERAMRCFDRAIASSPKHLDARWNRAITLLAIGRWTEGWQAYECRLERPEYASRHFDAVRWQGEDLAGRSILFWGEQGLGDNIQFLRFAEQLRALGAHVAIECQPRLVPLLAASGWTVMARGDTLPGTDFEAPMLSLPGLLRAQPDALPPPPRLTVPSERLHVWETLVGAPERLRVGVVWGAQAANFAGRFRSMPLAALQPIGEMPGIRWISLQHGAQSAELAANPWVERIDEPTGDILDTAALIANLDLVVSVDTMTAHLAGALGTPVWTVLPYSADWRWMQTGAPCGPAGTAWYPSMRLFRQPRRGDWAGLVLQLHKELVRLLGSSKPARC